jgi:hypothetical protein
MRERVDCGCKSKLGARNCAFIQICGKCFNWIARSALHVCARTCAGHVVGFCCSVADRTVRRKCVQL